MANLEVLSLGQLKYLLGCLRLAEAELAPFLRFDPARYCRNTVATGAGFEIVMIGWRAGQRSPIHDHAGSACAVKVISGIATETTFDVSDPSRPRRQATRRLHPGDITASLDRDAHRVTAAHGDLVTLHVYVPTLTAMTVYPDERP